MLAQCVQVVEDQQRVEVAQRRGQRGVVRAGRRVEPEDHGDLRAGLGGAHDIADLYEPDAVGTPGALVLPAAGRLGQRGLAHAAGAV
ncbi:MAG TPA: hypothetical protein VF897_25050, partial [Roseiflexaceae bacterium]